MRSFGKGSLSAVTQVKVSSPEIILISLGQGFHFLETSIDAHVKGECVIDVAGSKSAAGKQTVHIGTWENRSVPKGSRQIAEKVMRRYGVSVVGLTHSRGVAGVMPCGAISLLEGVSGLTQRGEF
ncbi:hypothetical protein [Sedimentisphaera salicampi]|uniref:Uncharacterized protein n=1 Tax=Sedimentisphaera salicampi TaxID=1941349 RepID=A0A1W6LPP4_9BACT|nr:hypothetical protein [Sedimentisphaera salicampi]ARN57181.1 hypothetical protein STSP1_01578 [Sedimentisphaera salicampi]ARN57349.1 hypothetical protein STSP1_01754 [Sedimentisphaera salicampi]ARN57775.1 hypothetical protein STSP1_02201 [Sedimentisphaera salicampi]